MKTEMAKLEIDNIDETQVPVIIAGQVQEIKRLETSVKYALEKADEAKESAEFARDHSAGWGHKKAAIEALQEATSDLAEAQVATMDAQTISFEYQKKLGEITKYLFALGCTNIAMNRSVVRELKLALEGASQEELDELARQEIMAVIKQLKSQEDIMSQQEKLSKRVKSNTQKIAHNASVNESLRQQVQAEQEKNLEQDRLLSAQAEKSVEHDKLLAEGVEHDKKQDEEISAQAAKDEEHDKLLAEGAEYDKKQDEKISAQEEKNEEQDKLLAERAEHDKRQDEEISAQAAKDEEHDKLLAEGAAHDKKQDEKISIQEEKNREQDTLIAELQKQNLALQTLIINNANEVSALRDDIDKIKRNKSGKSATVISYIIAIISLIVATIQFFT